MKILKIIGLVIIGFILILTITIFSVSTDFSYEKTVTINAPIEVVWENVNSLEDLNRWSPWVALDPNIEINMTGTDGTVGATSSWESDVEDVGAGSQTIVKIDAPNYFGSDIKFIKPWESEARGFIQLVEKDGGTEVTWGFESEMPRPVNMMKVVMDMDAAMDTEFSKGLNTLKNFCEN